MILRIEDIDPDRSRAHYTETLMDDMRWLGLDWDEGPDVGGPTGPYCQDSRRQLYQMALEKLDAAGLIYPCYCTRGELASLAPHGAEGERPYPGRCRNRAEQSAVSGRQPALRLAVPPGTIEFEDGVRGRHSQNIAAVAGDFIVRRSDGVHAYQLAVVVDDAAMGITHVLRGEDLLESTPRQILLYKLLGFMPPVFAHVPLLIADDGHRLSKRQRDLSLAVLREKGARPENITGYLAWKAGILEQFEPASPAELTGQFDLARIPSGPVVIGSEAIRCSGADI
jgi:glutamyl-tRNA synthetase